MKLRLKKCSIIIAVNVILLLLPVILFSQSQVKEIAIPGIELKSSWINQPVDAFLSADTLTIVAGPETNMFIAPGNTFNVCNMPMLVFEPVGDFSLSAQVEAKQIEQWDAAMLVVYVNNEYWAKLCFEMPQMNLKRMVSVVNNVISDDAYHDIIEGNEVFMRVSKRGLRITQSYSVDGTNWVDVRYFALNNTDKLKVGFASQSPRGEGFTSKFYNISYSSK